MSVGTILISLGILVLSPLWVMYTYISCNGYNCAMSEPALEIYNAPDHLEALKNLLVRELPTFSPYATRLFFSWLTFQAVLYAFLPANIGYGQRTPAGHLLPYKVRCRKGISTRAPKAENLQEN